MNKPITMVIDEFKNSIVLAINSSHLPMWVVADIIKDFAEQTKDLAKQQAEAERRAYEESIKEE